MITNGGPRAGIVTNRARGCPPTRRWAGDEARSAIAALRRAGSGRPARRGRARDHAHAVGRWLPPAPYFWLDNGSRVGRQQTRSSNRDIRLIVSDIGPPGDDPCFAGIVSDRLEDCGHHRVRVSTRAINPRWRHRVSGWRQFRGPGRPARSKAPMLASVGFDRPPIGGETALIDDLPESTLRAAARNAILQSHMVWHGVGHALQPGLLRSIAMVRSGKHANMIDLKHSGVVTVVDLGRICARKDRIGAVNTRARLEAAIEAGAVSRSGGRDPSDAADRITGPRLRRQAAQIQRGARADTCEPTVGTPDFASGRRAMPSWWSRRCRARQIGRRVVGPRGRARRCRCCWSPPVSPPAPAPASVSTRALCRTCGCLGGWWCRSPPDGARSPRRWPRNTASVPPGTTPCPTVRGDRPGRYARRCPSPDPDPTLDPERRGAGRRHHPHPARCSARKCGDPLRVSPFQLRPGTSRR